MDEEIVRFPITICGDNHRDIVMWLNEHIGNSPGDWKIHGKVLKPLRMKKRPIVRYVEVCPEKAKDLDVNSVRVMLSLL